MSSESAAALIASAVSVKREDVARAKDWLVHFDGTNTSGMADEWLHQQGLVEVRKVDTDADNCSDVLASVARAYSMRLAFYHAAWELIASGVLVSEGTTGMWRAELEYDTMRMRGGISIPDISFPFPGRVHRIVTGADRPLDIDIFLRGIECSTLHSGIVEAIDQSLVCFRRGLYMPATVMLAAAAEATWMESGAAIAESLTDSRLQRTVADSFAGFAKVVSDVRKTLESKGKLLLQNAGVTIHQVVDAEIWTTALRDRRNALHWGKAKSFTADHSETGTLLMAAPQHLRTLEAIRVAC